MEPSPPARELFEAVSQAPYTGGPNRFTYWLATTNADGTPHVAAVGMLPIDGVLCGISGLDTRKSRNLARDPRCVLTASMHRFDLAVEGSAQIPRDLTCLAYIAKDGTPRSIPIGFAWNGSEIVMCTAKNAPKLPALRHNPEVALTIDTEVHPPKILLIRGRAAGGGVDAMVKRSSSTMTTTSPPMRGYWPVPFETDPDLRGRCMRSPGCGGVPEPTPALALMACAAAWTLWRPYDPGDGQPPAQRP